jgi:RNA polymerase sigma factor (sigma-70 family)
MPKYLDRTDKLTLAGQEFAAKLYNPAVSSIIKWLADGQANQYSRYGKLPQHVLDAAEIDRYLREDIALETFVVTLPGFLARLDDDNNNDYDPKRSSIESYFIGACRNRLGDVIRSHQVPVAELRADTDDLLAILRTSDAGLADFEGRDLARHLLLGAPHDLRDALMLRIYEGITLGEAAQELGLNPATVRSHLLRFKKKILRLHFLGKIEIPEDTALGQWVSTRARATFGVRTAVPALQNKSTETFELSVTSSSVSE